MTINSSAQNFTKKDLNFLYSEVEVDEIRWELVRVVSHLADQ